MSKKWHFPLGDAGAKEGFLDPGMMHFNDNYHLHTARETIQNVLDARHNSYQPAEVTFTVLSVPKTEALPDSGKFKYHLEATKDFCTGRSSEGKKFFNDAISLISKDTIDIMIISDKNTTGITGINTSNGSKWDNLILTKGDSKSEGPGGGTYGIGKHAPFGCSGLRTVLYYTQTQDNNVGYIWNSILTSHYASDLKSPRGKYCNFVEADDKVPMQGLTSFDKRPSFINRNEAGTDVCIIGFMDPKNTSNSWLIDFKNHIMNEYFNAIYSKELIVNLNDDRSDKHITINSDNIYEIMEIDYLKNKEKSNFPFLDSIVNNDNSDNSYFFKDKLKHLGKCELYIKINKKYKQQIGFMRRPKMLVYKDNNRTLNDYAGVFVCIDDKGNNNLRKMEGVSHSDWISNRHRDPAKARSIKININKFIKESLITLKSDFFKQDSIIEGLEKILGYDEEDSDKNLNNNEQETFELANEQVSPWEDLKSIPKPAIKKKSKKKKVKGGAKDSGDDEGLGTGGRSDTSTGGGTIQGGDGFGDLRGGSEGEYKFKKISDSNYSFKCFKTKGLGSYKFKIKSQKTNINEKCNIHFYVRGLDADNNETLIVKSVKSCSTNQVYEVHDNQLKGLAIFNDYESFDISFISTEKCAVNIEVYG